MSDIFKQLTEKAEEAKERWGKIEQARDELKKNIEGQYIVRADLRLVVELLLLLVDHLEPVNADPKQVAKIQNEIKGMLNSFSGGK